MMMKYSVLIVAISVIVLDVAQMTEECHRPELCTSVISIAPVATHSIIDSADCSGSHLEVSWSRSTPSGCLITSLSLTYTCFSLGEVEIDTFLMEDTSTSLSRNLSVIDQSSPITECQISGHYIISSDECVEVLQPKRLNCSAEHHMDLPTLATQTESENNHLRVTDELFSLTTTSKYSQPRTTNSNDDEGNATTVLVMDDAVASSMLFTVVITIESIIAVLLMILIVILIIALIKKRTNCQMWRPNSVRSKSESDSNSKETNV